MIYRPTAFCALQKTTFLFLSKCKCSISITKSTMPYAYSRVVSYSPLQYLSAIPFVKVTFMQKMFLSGPPPTHKWTENRHPGIPVTQCMMGKVIELSSPGDKNSQKKTQRPYWWLPKRLLLSALWPITSDKIRRSSRRRRRRSRNRNQEETEEQAVTATIEQEQEYII